LRRQTELNLQNIQFWCLIFYFVTRNSKIAKPNSNRTPSPKNDQNIISPSGIDNKSSRNNQRYRMMRHIMGKKQMPARLKKFFKVSNSWCKQIKRAKPFISRYFEVFFNVVGEGLSLYFARTTFKMHKRTFTPLYFTAVQRAL